MASIKGNPPTSNRRRYLPGRLDILIVSKYILIKMSSAAIHKKLQGLTARHNNLVEQILRSPPILRGSFTRVSTRCGKSTCWCAQTPKGHSHTRITWSEHGTMITRKVPPEQVQRIVELTRSYRRFRSQCRQLRLLQAAISEAVGGYGKVLMEQTRRPLAFLAVESKMEGPSQKRRQKTRAKQKRNVQ